MCDCSVDLVVEQSSYNRSSLLPHYLLSRGVRAIVELSLWPSWRPTKALEMPRSWCWPSCPPPPPMLAPDPLPAPPLPEKNKLKKFVKSNDINFHNIIMIFFFFGKSIFFNLPPPPSRGITDHPRVTRSNPHVKRLGVVSSLHEQAQTIRAWPCLEDRGSLPALCPLMS